MRRFFTSSQLCFNAKSKLAKKPPNAEELFKDFRSQYDPEWRQKSYKSIVETKESKFTRKKSKKGEREHADDTKMNRKARRRLLFQKNVETSNYKKSNGNTEKKTGKAENKIARSLSNLTEDELAEAEAEAEAEMEAEMEAELQAQLEAGIGSEVFAKLDVAQDGTEDEPPSVSLISSKKISYSQYIVDGQPPVPQLANNLDKVLFNPGVHFLKDVRTNVYNFSPSLENIMSIKDFDFSKVPTFVPSGKDNKLSRLAQQENKRYTASTSSITGILGQLHGALSYGRPASLMGMSKYFGGRTTTFTTAQKMPTKFFLRYNETTKTHAVSAAPVSSSEGETVLSLLGQAMEAMLVTDSKEFANYDRLLSHCLPKEEPISTYNYMQCGPFMLRSQLDCYDPRLPGTGTFDLKTRAVCAVRHDMDYSQIKDGCDYQIIKRDGMEESYAREMFELIRSALFKYSLQGRIGSMDGIFVAYHNISNLFGFEYLPLNDIDVIFHTAHLFDTNRLTPDLHERAARVGPLIAEKEFGLSLGVLEKILDLIIKKDPSKDYFVYMHNSAPNGLTIVYKQVDESQEEPKPTEFSSFRCILNSSINGVKVAQGQHPHIENPGDVWEVALEVEHSSRAQGAFDYQRMVEQYVPFELTSKPAVERSENAQELEKDAMGKLEEPSEFQKRLRTLQEKGKRFKEQNESRKKIIWEPASPEN